MKKKNRLLLHGLQGILALCLSLCAWAQQTITGVIRDDRNAPVAGVTVTVKGTNRSAVTDDAGRYSITAKSTDVLVFSSIGFVPKEVAVENRATVDYALQTNVITGDEVVIIGYQSVRKKDLTGAVSVINPTTANRNVSNTVAESIQGLTPGVTVRNTGQPGGGAKIDIRGAGTFAGNNPLYIIDGMYSDATPDFNPQDIESIQILKDASAAAIYGSRAANGVIIITTKKGREGPVVVNGALKYGIQNLHNRYDMMNASEYRDLATRLYQAGNLPVPTSLTTDFDPSIDTDWQEEFLRQGSIADLNLSFSGGSRTANFFISGSHFRNMGPVIDNAFERSSLRINTSASKGRLRFGENILLSYTHEDPIAATGVGVNPFVDMITMPPVVALKGPRYVSLENPEGWGLGLNNAYLNTLTANVPALQRLDQYDQYNFKIRGNAFAELQIIQGLMYKFNIGAEASFDRGKGLRRPGTVRQGTPSPNNNLATASQNRANFRSFLFEHTVNFDRNFRDHKISAVAGLTNQRDNYEILSGESRGFQPDAFGNYLFTNLNQGTAQLAASSSSERNFVSVLGRVNYSYTDRYLASFSFRRDGSSVFSRTNRWGNFPSASVAWRVSRESFFKVDKINDLKLRVSYGALGNSEFLSPWRYYAQINAFPRAVFGINETEQLGAIVTQLATTNLRWEKKKTTNFGIDASLLNNKITVTADYFIAKTDDVLVDLPINLTTGNAGAFPAVNAANIQNKGFELGLTYRGTAGRDFRWDATLNFTTIKNKVIGFGNPTTKYTQLGDARTEINRSIGEWYVLKTEGIFQNQAEIDAHKGKTGQVLQPWAKPGDIRYIDVDDNGTLDIDKDRYFAGSPWADWETGLQLNGSYKNFTINMQWYAVVGNELYNRPRYNVDRMDQNTNFRKGATFWTASTPSTEWPRAAIGAPDQGIQFNVLPQSDRWLESGSYVRLRNVELAYTFQNKLLKRVGFTNSRVFVNGQNLLTFTKYTGLDPDITGVNIFERGLDNGQYPALRIFSAGVNFGF